MHFCNQRVCRLINAKSTYPLLENDIRVITIINTLQKCEDIIKDVTKGVMMLKDYEDFYKQGGFNYDKNKEKYETWLFEKTPINAYNENCTLLDVGCGDGFWSFLLASKFNVTGVDISKTGIEVANKKVKNMNLQNINFICGNALELDSKYDIVFCRGPSFLNLPPSDGKFIQNLKKMLSICNVGLIYIQSTKKPYGRWSKSSLFDERADSEYYNSRWYYHDPNELERLFNEFGDATVKDIDSYIVAEIRKTNIGN